MQANPSGFITPEEAVALIKAHTNEEPTVDLKFLVVNRDYIEKAHNFTIKLLKKTADNKVVEDGVIFTRISNDRDKYNLREEIKDAYKRNMGLELNLDERPTTNMTTVVDPQTNPKGQPMEDKSNDPLYTPDRNTTI